MAASVLLAQLVYDVPANVILNSAARAVTAWDVVTSMIKSWVFGVIISVVSARCGFIPRYTGPWPHACGVIRCKIASGHF